MCVTKFGYKNGNSVAATFRAFRVCDFFLWGYAKDQVYANNPKNLEQLKTNLREVMAEILPQMCRNIIGNFLRRIEACKRFRGGHLNDVLFRVQGSIFILEILIQSEYSISPSMK